MSGMMRCPNHAANVEGGYTIGISTQPINANQNANQNANACNQRVSTVKCKCRERNRSA